MSDNIPSQAQKVNHWLQQGIAAVKAGKRQQARGLLLRVVEQDKKNISAWLWLSAVVDSLEDQETCLAHVLSLDPHNQAATRGLATVRQKLVDDYIQRGTAAAKSGQRAQARELLERVLTWDENNVEARTLLSSIVETREERETRLKKAQALDPDDEATHHALVMIQRRQRVAQGAGVAKEPVQVPVPRQAATQAMIEPTPVAVIEKEPAERPVSSDSGMSTAFWGTVGIQFLNSINYLALLLWTLFNLVLQIRALVFASGDGQADGELGNPLQSLLSFQNPMDLLSLYLGLPHDVSPEIADMAFELLPRGIFILQSLPIVFAVLTFVVLFIRVKPAYYLVMATAVLDALFVLSCFVSSPLAALVPMLFRGIVLVLAGIKMYLVFQIKDDFYRRNETLK